jgi:hypothetical protein
MSTVKAPGGTNPVKVHIAGKGYATGSATVTKAVTFTSVSPTSGSFAGGQEVTIVGKGLTKEGKIDICGAQCVFVSGDNETYTCKTTPLLTDASMTASNDQALTPTGIDAHVSSGNGSFTYATKPAYVASPKLDAEHGPEMAFDGDLDTYYKAAPDDTNAADEIDICHIGIDAGEGYLI